MSLKLIADDLQSDIPTVYRDGSNIQRKFDNIQVREFKDFRNHILPSPTERTEWDNGIIKEKPKTCFLFPTVATNYPGMGNSLYNCCQIFRAYFDECAGIFRTVYNLEVIQIGDNFKSEIKYGAASAMCVQYGLMKLWESWGVRADYVLGHCAGEYCAAVCSGILTLSEAVMLLVEQSYITPKLPPGDMLAIRADEEWVNASIKLLGIPEGQKEASLEVANVNSGEQTIVAGDTASIANFAKFCVMKNIKCSRLGLSHAFHSSSVGCIQNEIGEICSKIKAKNERAFKNKPGYISAMMGGVVQAENVDSQYWSQHLRQKVSFLSASRAAVKLNCRIFLEIGAHPVLTSLVLQNAKDEKVICLPSLKRTEDGGMTLLSSLKKLYQEGVKINLRAVEQS